MKAIALTLFLLFLPLFFFFLLEYFSLIPKGWDVFYLGLVMFLGYIFIYVPLTVFISSLKEAREEASHADML